MDNQAVRDRMRELEEYRARPGAGWWLLATVGIMAGIVAFSAYGLQNMDDRSQHLPKEGLGYLMGLIVIACAVVAWLVPFAMTGGDIAGWLHNYWIRSVQGRSVRLVFASDEDGTFVVTRADYHETAMRMARGHQGISIILPLGGWRKRPTLYLGPGMVRSFARWRIELALWHVTSGTIMLRLTDEKGDRVTLDAKRALWLIMSHVTLMTAAWYDWENTMRGLLIDRDCDRRNLEALRTQAELLAHQLRAASRDRDRAIQVIEGTIAELERSKRFMQSKAAKALRERLVRELLTLLAPDDSRRPALEAQLEQPPAAPTPPAA